MRSNADGRGWIRLNYVLLKYNSSEGIRAILTMSNESIVAVAV